MRRVDISFAPNLFSMPDKNNLRCFITDIHLSLRFSPEWLTSWIKLAKLLEKLPMNAISFSVNGFWHTVKTTDAFKKVIEYSSDIREKTYAYRALYNILEDIHYLRQWTTLRLADNPEEKPSAIRRQQADLILLFYCWTKRYFRLVEEQRYQYLNEAYEMIDAIHKLRNYPPKKENRRYSEICMTQQTITQGQQQPAAAVASPPPSLPRAAVQHQSASSAPPEPTAAVERVPRGSVYSRDPYNKSGRFFVLHPDSAKPHCQHPTSKINNPGFK